MLKETQTESQLERSGKKLKLDRAEETRIIIPAIKGRRLTALVISGVETAF
jgi:hypothetical protein